MRLRYDFFIIGYVVMPEHVHLLVSEPREMILAKALQALKLSVAKRQRDRPFWQARYYDFNVYTPNKRIEKLRYMHRNPVKRGLAAAPEDWKWSSFRHYATGEIGTIEIESHWTANRRDHSTANTHVSEARRGCTLILIKYSGEPLKWSRVAFDSVMYARKRFLRAKLTSTTSLKQLRGRSSSISASTVA
jgi:putative transposase